MDSDETGELGPGPSRSRAGAADPLAGVVDALGHLRALFAPTPCQRNAFLSERHGADVWLKREDLSPVRSYKVRGAWNAMRKRPGLGAVICASAGNHAQGVAFACRQMGVRGEVFMPVTTPEQKRMKTLQFGGGLVEIVLTGDTFDECLAAARAREAQTGAHFLSPFDDDDVIEGQATVALEILEQMGAPDMIVLPVGGGGLAAGTSLVLRGRAPEVAMRFVEPERAASLAAALAAGRPATLPSISGFVDGAAVARIGERTHAILAGTDPAHVLGVPEDRLCGTIVEMLNVEGIVLEPAGALAIDALRDLDVAGRRVVCVVSGGNFDFERLPEVRERAQRFAGLKRYYLLRLPQRPGALRDFLGVLGPGDDIARFEYLKKSARNFGTVLIGIEGATPGALAGMEARAAGAGFALRDITGDPALAELVI